MRPAATNARGAAKRVIHGLHNKLQVAAASVLGGGASAAMHRFIAEPGTALEEDKSDPR